MNKFVKEKECLLAIGAWECEQNTPHHVYNVGVHTEKVVEYCLEHGAGDELLRAAWLHDVGKIEVKYNDGKYDRFSGHPEISARIAQELGESDYVVELIKYHDSHRDKRVDFKALASKGRNWCEDLALLMIADLAGQNQTYKIGEKLIGRGEFINKLFAELDNN